MVYGRHIFVHAVGSHSLDILFVGTSAKLLGLAPRLVVGLEAKKHYDLVERRFSRYLLDCILITSVENIRIYLGLVESRVILGQCRGKRVGLMIPVCREA